MYDDDSVVLPENSVLRVLFDYFLSEGLAAGFIEGGFKAVAEELPFLIAKETNSTSQFSWDDKSPADSSFDGARLQFMDSFLAIGGEAEAHDISLLNSHSVTHVLNLTFKDCHPEVLRTRTSLKIALADTLSENLLVHLQSSFEFLESARRSNGRVLVNCYAGISRSVAVAVAYFMWSRHMSLPNALSLVQAHRGCASPNLNFMGQLLAFQHVLNNLPPTQASLEGAPDPRVVGELCQSALENLELVSVFS